MARAKQAMPRCYTLTLWSGCRSATRLMPHTSKQRREEGPHSHAHGARPVVPALDQGAAQRENAAARQKPAAARQKPACGEVKRLLCI